VKSAAKPKPPIITERINGGAPTTEAEISRLL
jgi:hypothetical protein